MAAYSISPVDASWGNGGVGGLGALASGSQIALSTVSSAGTILTGTAPAWMSVATAAWAVPVIGAVVAGVTLALMAIMSRKGPKQKVATTEIVNKIEPLLQENLAGYLAGTHTVSSQAQALANFDAGWQYVVEYCDIPEMGNPGKACVSDRQAGACMWKDQGECWNWFVGYRDPIANDPNVKADPVLGAAGELIDSVTGQLFQSVSGGGSGMLLLAGLAVAGVFLIGGKK